MILNPDFLLTFAAVARSGSVSAAADTLHRSQPAVSLQLKQLAEAVGEPLYRRHRYGVTLTPAGEALLPYAQSLSRSLQGAAALVGEWRGLTRGTLRVSASMTVAVYLLPGVLARFRARYPDLELHLLTRNSAEVVALLQAGAADVGFVEGPPDGLPAGLTTKQFFEDDLVLVVRPDHALAANEAVTPRELTGLTVVRREAGSGTRAVVDRALAEAGVTVVTALEATGLEAVKEAVLEGLGAAFLSKLAVQRELAAGLLNIVPVPGVALARPLTLLHPAPQLTSQATRAFLDFFDTTTVDIADNPPTRSG